MTTSSTISWIFLAVAMASGTEPSDLRGISMIADGINHAVPSQKELQSSISWLINEQLIVKNEQKYNLTDKGRLLYESAKEDSKYLLKTWTALEIKISKML